MMKPNFVGVLFLLVLVVAVQGNPIENFLPEQTVAPSSQTASIAGRWRVKFSLAGVGERNLEFVSQVQGTGTFLLIDAVPNEKPATIPAAWAETSNDRVNFSGEVELQLNCCREKGTLIFKGKFSSKDTITGKVIFVGTTDDEENFNGFVSTVGSFTASRVFK